MFHNVTIAWFIFAIAAITTAQVYEDLESTYGVPVAAPDDDVVTYGDEDLDYGDEGATNGDDYAGYDDYYTDDEYVNVSFSAERLKELYTCLCLGAFRECNIHYSVDGHTWTVNLIEKTGSLKAESDQCKYYMCSHTTGSHTIACSQVEQRSTACGEGESAQFFQQKTHECCGATCVGIFWQSVEEKLIFLHNTSDLQSCNSTCLCPTNGEDGTSVVKVTEQSFPNETLVDKYVINKPTTGKSTSPLQGGSNPALTSLQAPGISTSTSISGDVVSTANGSKSGQSPSYEISEKIEKTIILATVVAIVSAIIVAGCILVGIMIFRRRNRRSMKLNTNDNPTKSGDASTAQLSYASPSTAVEVPATHYPRTTTDNVAATSLHEYHESPTFPGNSKNGVNALNSTYIGNSQGNKPRQTIIHSKPRPQSQPRDSPANDLSDANEPNRTEGSFVEISVNSRRGLKPPNRGQQSSNEIEGQDGGNSKVKDGPDPRNGDSARLIDGKHEVDKRGLARKEPNYKGGTGGRDSDDQESRQPLLTFRKIKESIV